MTLADRIRELRALLEKYPEPPWGFPIDGCPAREVIDVWDALPELLEAAEALVRLTAIRGQNESGWYPRDHEDIDRERALWAEARRLVGGGK